MSYATVAQLRAYLTQVPAGAAIDAALQEVLDAATDIVEVGLGFAFTAWGLAATGKDVQAAGGAWLELPGHKAASVTAVLEVSSRGKTSESTIAVTGYIQEDDGRLYHCDGWGRRAWYRVTAIWGYGPAPASIVEVTRELGVNLWRGKDRGMYSDVIGVEGGGAVGYARALTNQQRMIIDGVRTRTLGVVHG